MPLFNKTAVTAAGVVGTLIAVLGPVLIALYVAKQKGMEGESLRAVVYARDVLRRTEVAADQIFSATLELSKLGRDEPCSAQNIELMRKIAIAYGVIQAIGHVTGNVMDCSSMGSEISDFDLGPADLEQPNGAKVRRNVVLPFAGGLKSFVVERDGYAVVGDLSRSVDASVEGEDIVLAMFVPSSNFPAISRNTVRPEWMPRLGGNDKVTFADPDYFVAIVKSDRYDVAAIAAIPISHLSQRVWSTAVIAVPFGVIGAILLAYVIFQLSRLQRALPSVLKLALKQNEFFLEYQPIVDLESGKWIGAEALIRWQRSNGEVVRPDLFISVAEDTGLIRKITERVLSLIEQDAGNLFELYPEFHLSINLSAADLHDDATPGQLFKLAKAIKAGPGNIIVEATERSLTDPELATRNYQKLRAEGISIAIDDFGTGYSSLSSLEKFELDYLKIDKSFVEAVGTEAATSQVAPHIVEIAKALNLTIIAEGVETREQADFLKGLGVRHAQGWLFAKPMRIDVLFRQLAANRTKHRPN